MTGAGPGRADGMAGAPRGKAAAAAGGTTSSAGGAVLAAGGAQEAAGGGWGVRDACVSYGRTVALDRVSLAAAPGQVTAVVGGDGAGKSTLLRCLAGTQAPSSGLVRGPGARQTGYLPASSGIYPDLTVAENLAFRAAAYGLRPDAARDRSAVLIKQAGLAAASDRLAGQLSGGMRQKLGVICALLHRPGLLILDEPTTGVDPVSRSGLWRLISGAAAGGAAVVVATAYLDEARRAAAVLVLDSGRALAAGTPEQIVEGLPGAIVAPAAPPGPAGQPRSWRRAGAWRLWVPPGTTSDAAGTPVTPDLQDAVTVAALAHELRNTPGYASEAGPEAARTAAPTGAAGPVSAAEPGPIHSAAEPGPIHSAGLAVVPVSPGRTGPDQAAPDRAAADRAAGPGALAECAGVTRRFGSFTAVREVSLRVEPGEIVGLLGANGAGKTTVIRMLLGLLHPSAGTVALFSEPPSRQTRRRLGYVPQSLGLYDDLTVAENLAFSAAVFGTSPPAVPAGLGSPGRMPVGRLSLGVQRRAAFAQALAHQPDLLILDEPTSGVDPLGRARLWDTVRSAAEGGAGVLITTHYMEEAQECDRLVIMADGVVVAGGTPAQVTGDASVTVVAAAAWEAAFRRLEEAGLNVTLAGHALRLATASTDQVRQALYGGDEPAGRLAPDAVRVYSAPATLEERFFQLVQSGPGSAPAVREAAEYA